MESRTPQTPLGTPVPLMICGPGSSVGKVTEYGLDGPGSNPGGVDEIFRTCPDRS